MDGSDPLVKANVTYPPDQCATAVSLVVMGARGEPMPNFYQKKLPVRAILSAGIATEENAELYYHRRRRKPHRPAVACIAWASKAGAESANSHLCHK